MSKNYSRAVFAALMRQQATAKKQHDEYLALLKEQGYTVIEHSETDASILVSSPKVPK